MEEMARAWTAERALDPGKYPPKSRASMHRPARGRIRSISEKSRDNSRDGGAPNGSTLAPKWGRIHERVTTSPRLDSGVLSVRWDVMLDLQTRVQPPTHPHPAGTRGREFSLERTRPPPRSLDLMLIRSETFRCFCAIKMKLHTFDSFSRLIRIR